MSIFISMAISSSIIRIRIHIHILIHTYIHIYIHILNITKWFTSVLKLCYFCAHRVKLESRWIILVFFTSEYGFIVERGDGSYDSTSLFLYIRQLL